MRRNPGSIVLVERRIFDLRQTARQTVKTNVDTQLLRNTWIEKLDDLFSMATSMAKGGSKPQQVGDKPEIIAPKERQLWAHVAAHTAEVMGNLARGFDERQFNEDLAELERLVDEIKKLQAQRAEKGDRPAESKPADKCSETGIESGSDL
jgi:hypothetical protein